MAEELIPSFRQAFVVFVVVTATAIMAFVGLGAAARLFYMACGIMAALWYHRRCPWLYLTLTFWFWTLTPFVRRLIDEHAGFDAVNIILVTPNLMAMVILRDMLQSRNLLRRRETLLALMLLLPALYGLAVSFVMGEILAGAVNAADWIAPLLYLFFLIDKAQFIRQGEQHLRGFITLNSIVVVGYGLYQFWEPPQWDTDWARASHMLGASEMEAGAFHVFGTLNDPGILAGWLGALILLSLYFRTSLTVIMLPVTIFLLGLTLVRSVAVGLVLSLGIAIILGGGRMIRGLVSMLFALAVAATILITFDSRVANSVVTRLSTLSELQGDTSAIQRAAIWASAPALIADHPVGMGIGALGRGAVVSGNADLVSIDAGPLAIYLSLGWVAGTIYLLGMFMVVGNALVMALRLNSPAPIACAAAALCSFMELAMVNIDGFAGTILWLCGGLAIAYGIHDRLLQTDASGTPARMLRARPSAGRPRAFDIWPPKSSG